MTIAEAAPPQFETKDSGRRDTYASGMYRGPATGRPRFDLLVPEDVPFDHQLAETTAYKIEQGSRHTDRTS